MDERCPVCRTDLHGRYLGALGIRCPHCSSVLQHNIHPQENGPWHLEIGLYAFGFTSLLIAALASFLLDWPTLAALPISLLAIATYAWLAWRRARRQIPEDWPRWRE